MASLLVYMSAEDLARLGSLIFAGRNVLIEGFIESSLLIHLSSFTVRDPIIADDACTLLNLQCTTGILPIYPNVPAELLPELFNVDGGWVATTRKVNLTPPSTIPVYHMSSQKWSNAPEPLAFFLEAVRFASKTRDLSRVIKAITSVVEAKASAVWEMLEAGLAFSEALQTATSSLEEAQVILLRLESEHGLPASRSEVLDALRRVTNASKHPK
nr:hypothetical protein [Candidatus Freyrarchaeum guaymaensis]